MDMTNQEGSQGQSSPNLWPLHQVKPGKKNIFSVTWLRGYRTCCLSWAYTWVSDIFSIIWLHRYRTCFLSCAYTWGPDIFLCHVALHVYRISPCHMTLYEYLIYFLPFDSAWIPDIIAVMWHYMLHVYRTYFFSRVIYLNLSPESYFYSIHLVPNIIILNLTQYYMYVVLVTV